ncbi:Endonuclease/exonuclease/phosphatase [Mycena amicta]|nr:Endonuclease/exonuclease/phosphatase [Mycena amicta]
MPSLRIVTFNIACSPYSDGISVKKSLDSIPDPLVQPPYLGLDGRSEQPWSTRRLYIAEQLLSAGISLAGFQEPVKQQVDDLAELLGDDWAWVGDAREGGSGAYDDEFNPIFYKKSKLSLISTDTFWTSLTPFKVSKYPGAGYYRICTVARFQHTDGGATFTLMNTHTDDGFDEQRTFAASLILYRARYELYTTGAPVFVTGDFNSTPNGSDSSAYNIMTALAPPLPDSSLPSDFVQKYSVSAFKSKQFIMYDLMGAAPRRAARRNFATYTGFVQPGDTSQWMRIDYIFGSELDGKRQTADEYKVETSRTDDGLLSSDHRPVFCDVTIS